MCHLSVQNETNICKDMSHFLQHCSNATSVQSIELLKIKIK